MIHGNLTNNKILVAADGSPRIADFGVSNVMVKTNPAFSYQTAVRWAAPELLVIQEGQAVQCATESSDIYALGCIILQVLYNKFPYWWIGSDLQIVRSKLNHQKPIDTMQMQMRAHHLDFMRQYWSRKSKCRPAAEEVLDFLEEATCVTLGAEMISFLVFTIMIPSYIQNALTHDIDPQPPQDSAS